jgi:diguanylate cyclase (GGDEF)-like protein/PAS domain S-box-containing protein
MQQNIIGPQNWMEFLPQMQILFDQLNDAVFIIDQAGNILITNKTASKFTGYETTELIGKPVDAFVLRRPVFSKEHEFFTEFNNRPKINISKDTFSKYQTDIVTKDSHNIAVEITYLPLSNSTQTVLCLIAKNISEQLIFKTLREINSTVSSSLDLVEVFDLLLVELRKLIPYDGGNIMKVGDNNVTITRTLGYDAFDENIPNFLYTLQFDIESTQNIKEIVDLKKTIIIQNIKEIPYWNHNAVSDLFLSWIGVPIIIDNKVNAIISLDKVKPNFFTEEHASLLQIFANQAALAIRNANFYTDATRAANRFMTLYQLSQIISTNVRTADIYPSIHQAISELMDTEFFSISLYDSAAQTITDVYMIDKDEPQELTTRPVEKGLFATVLKNGKSLLFNSFDAAAIEEMGVVLVGDNSTTDISQSILVVPLEIGARIIGVISAQSYKPNMYTNADRETLELLAANVAIAIENARLFDEVQKLAITDPLTQLNNRRKYEELAFKEFERSLRYDRPLCAIMIDLDLFKRINDTYGHLAGDQVLISIANLCKKDLRNIDILARYGGDEFIILLPETTVAQALLTAERLRQDCEANEVETTQGPIAITISLGVSELNKSCKTLEELVNRADQALFESKRTGRNKSTIWTPRIKHNFHSHSKPT